MLAPGGGESRYDTEKEKVRLILRAGCRRGRGPPRRELRLWGHEKEGITRAGAMRVGIR